MIRRCKLVNMACSPSCPDYARNLAACGHPLSQPIIAAPSQRGTPQRGREKELRPLAYPLATVGMLFGRLLDRVRNRLRLSVFRDPR